MNIKIQTTTHEEFMKELLSDPATKKVYDETRVQAKIYAALVRERIQHKLTQKQLAKKIGIAQSALARFESGRGNPTLAFLQKVTSALGLRLTVL